jgi:hypothetical protein
VAAGASQRGNGQVQRGLAAGQAMEPQPPSSAAMRSSSTALVGLLMRL